MIRCLGRRHCLVNASVEIFGDECPSIGKYLEVHYQCLVGSELSHHLLNNELIGEKYLIIYCIFYSENLVVE